MKLSELEITFRDATRICSASATIYWIDGFYVGTMELGKGGGDRNHPWMWAIGPRLSPPRARKVYDRVVTEWERHILNLVTS